MSSTPIHDTVYRQQPLAQQAPMTRDHDHRRGLYCPTLWATPWTPRKAASRWLFAWAEAQLHDETLAAFRAESGAMWWPGA